MTVDHTNFLDARFGDRLERSGNVALRGWSGAGVGLRHGVGGAVGRLGDGRSADVVGRLGRYRELLRLREIRTRCAVLVDDALRQQVGDGLTFSLWLGDAENLIGAAFFPNQNDNMLDRRSGFPLLDLVPAVVAVFLAVFVSL